MSSVRFTRAVTAGNAWPDAAVTSVNGRRVPGVTTAGGGCELFVTTAEVWRMLFVIFVVSK